MADSFCALLAKPTTALCHSSGSGAWVPALPFRIKSNFPSQKLKGLYNYRFCTQGVGSLGWVEQSQQEIEILVAGTTEKLWKLQILQSPSSNHAGFLNSLFFLNKDSTDTPLLATNMLQPSENLGPAQSVTAGQTEVPSGYRPLPRVPSKP